MDDLKLCGSNDNEIDSLVKVIKIVRGDNGLQFGFEKFTVLKMKRGKDGGRIQVSWNSTEGWYLTREDERRGAKEVI